MQTKSPSPSQPASLSFYFRASVSPSVNGGSAWPAWSKPLSGTSEAGGPHPRGSCEVRVREGRPPGISARGTGRAGGAHVCAEPEHN